MGGDASAGDRFYFVGFLPTQLNARKLLLESLQGLHCTLVLFEAPHRIKSLCATLAEVFDCEVSVGRELTKQFESIVTLHAKALPGWCLSKSEAAVTTNTAAQP
jgi:16S rRNA (cytidine1402-2'-O)-methyltransferase